MKFSVIQQNGVFLIKIGRASGGNIQVVGREYETKAEAQKSADAMNAHELIIKASRLLKGQDQSTINNLARTAQVTIVAQADDVD